jgi:hypothetical protein
MHVIFAENRHDEAWLEANTLGWRELRERAAAFDPERVAGITGLAAETIVALARRYADTKAGADQDRGRPATPRQRWPDGPRDLQPARHRGADRRARRRLRALRRR